jgi:hypothetical protein
VRVRVRVRVGVRVRARVRVRVRVRVEVRKSLHIRSIRVGGKYIEGHMRPKVPLQAMMPEHFQPIGLHEKGELNGGES